MKKLGRVSHRGDVGNRNFAKVIAAVLAEVSRRGD
jgi:hypothetical protein